MSSIKATIDQCLTQDRHSLHRQLANAKNKASRERVIQKIDASVEAVKKRLGGLPKIQYPAALPVSARSDELIELIQKHRVLIVAGETGSGKSTQLPKLCLAAGQGVFGQIAHTQPRRIAARSIANRLADELNIKLGEGVGYRVRFEDKSNANDYIRVLTDGMLLAEAQSDRFLNQYDTVIIDEAHERSLNIDFLLGFLKQLLRKRRDLKLIITSATIDTDKFSRHFNHAPIVNVSGRTFPVEVRYQTPENEKTRSDKQTNQAILLAINHLFKTRPGNTLVFLPGEREIREAQRFLTPKLKSGIDVLPLFARLAAKEQAKLFRASRTTRIILSTNVAETSLTLPDIDYVVDVGLARVSRYSPGRRVNTLPIERISKAAADQRKGRCGRVKNGVCIRLYSEEDFCEREEYTAPEILRTALTGVVLTLKSRRLGEPEDFPFIDPPERKQWNAARQELKLLGALDEQNALSKIGQALSRLPVDPKIGRMLYAATYTEKCLAEISIIGAILEIQDPRLVPHESMQAARQHHLEQAKGGCDFFALINLYHSFVTERTNLTRKQLTTWCLKNFLAPARMREWQDLVKRIRQDCQVFEQKLNKKPATEEAVHRALLTGLLDQVAMKSDKGSYTGTYGKQLSLFPGSALAKEAPKWIMAAEMVETSQLFARMVAPIKDTWIEEMAGDHLRYEYSEPQWSQKSGQVLAFQRGYFLNLPIFSGRRHPYANINPEECRALFIRDGLVPGEINIEIDFIQANLAMIDQVIALEHKVRRHDILVSEEVLARFYTKQLPENVLSEASLLKWLKTCSPDVKRALFVTKDSLLKRELDSTEVDLPDQLYAGKHKLDLDYHFAPGESSDGISARVPLPLLNQLSQAQFDKLVPGYLAEKIEHLIRSLPKGIRKQLAPITETANSANALLKEDQRPLLEALADTLNAKIGSKLSPQDFNLTSLPAHLSMKLVLVDEAGDELGRANQLTKLQEKFGNQARASFNEAQHQWQKQGLTRWDFDPLPDAVDIGAHGVKTHAYPALVDADTAVDLQLFDDASEALSAHQSGVARLLIIGTQFGQKLSKRSLPYWQNISLRYSPIGSHHDLRRALIDAVVLNLVFSKGVTVRNEHEFNIQAANLEKQFGAAIEPYCKALDTALVAFSETKHALEKHSFPTQSTADIKTQLDYLLYEDFLVEVPLEIMLKYPVYFKALKTRIERLRFDPLGDAKKLTQLEPYWNNYLAHWEENPFNEALDDYRWLVEAYRVSLFAPQVKPPQPVSTKRLDQAWSAFMHTTF